MYTWSFIHTKDSTKTDVRAFPLFFLIERIELNLIKFSKKNSHSFQREY